MTFSDFHIHTTYCDGSDSAENIVKEAINKNIKRIGFSGHSYTFFDESYCMTESGTKEYKAEIARLKEKYKDKIEILCGVEQDYYSKAPTDGYDYVIGSVHYLKADGEYFPIDESADILLAAAKKHYGGDIYALAEDYFETVSHIKGADIIGHFDLITKFNEVQKLFDEKNERYVAAYKKAVDTLLIQNVPFEINTGAISRGYRTAPYPSTDIVRYIRENGGRTILSSDSHQKETLCFEFEKYKDY